MEKHFRAQVVDLASTYGWRPMFHETEVREIRTRRGIVRVRTVNLQGVGFPDLVLVRAHRGAPQLIFAELKRDRGPRGGGQHEHVEPTEAQETWLADLRAVASFAMPIDNGAAQPVNVYVWRPSDLDRIERILRVGGE